MKSGLTDLSGKAGLGRPEFTRTPGKRGHVQKGKNGRVPQRRGGKEHDCVRLGWIRYGDKKVRGQGTSGG